MPMIQIKNDIGKEFSCDVYHGENKIGVCTDALAFYDLLCQVKNEQAEGYYIVVKCKLENGDIRKCKLEITKDGRIHPMSKKGVRLWNTILEEQLLFLHGFKNEIIYSEKAPIAMYV